MATKLLAQPALYLDGVPRISQNNDLFTVEYDGLSLKLTPYAMMALVLKSRQVMGDWNAMNNAKAAGYMVEDTAEIVPFRKSRKVARRRGEVL
jgi:hypothetical protein